MGQLKMNEFLKYVSQYAEVAITLVTANEMHRIEWNLLHMQINDIVWFEIHSILPVATNFSMHHRMEDFRGLI